MNKYVLRTSLVWAVLLAVVLGVLFYRSHPSLSRVARPRTLAADPQPVAAGPAVKDADAAPAQQESGQAQIAPVQLTPERMQSIGVKTGTVEYKQVSDDIQATGTVEIDEQSVAYVQVRFAGYIRKVFANATYQYVRKGEPLFTVYSPELVATQQEYLLARQNQKALGASSIEGVALGANSLTLAAERRLEQWDIPESELVKLKETGKPISDIAVNSPVSGYITERNALPNMYVEPASRLYTIADLSRVWVNAQVFQNDIGRVKPGDPADVTVDAYPGHIFSGRILQVLPQVDMATRTVRVRLALQNPGLKLKPGMFVDVKLKSSLGRQLTVPASAVMQSGTGQMVFLDRGNGTFEPQRVDVGSRVGDDFIVVSGLKAHQRIVTSANFLIDSESQLQSAAGSFAPPPPGAGDAGATTHQQPAQANIDFTTQPSPPHKGNNTFRVKLTNASGAPMTGAQVTVMFYMVAMPAMGMAAMNANASLTEKGNGLYEGQGALGSGGTWQVTINAQLGGKTLATKQLHVNAEGGM